MKKICFLFISSTFLNVPSYSDSFYLSICEYSYVLIHSITSQGILSSIWKLRIKITGQISLTDSADKCAMSREDDSTVNNKLEDVLTIKKVNKFDLWTWGFVWLLPTNGMKNES